MAGRRSWTDRRQGLRGRQLSARVVAGLVVALAHSVMGPVAGPARFGCRLVDHAACQCRAHRPDRIWPGRPGAALRMVRIGQPPAHRHRRVFWCAAAATPQKRQRVRCASHLPGRHAAGSPAECLAVRAQRHRHGPCPVVGWRAAGRTGGREADFSSIWQKALPLSLEYTPLSACIPANEARRHLRQS